jgi:hypothetical protein
MAAFLLALRRCPDDNGIVSPDPLHKERNTMRLFRAVALAGLLGLAIPGFAQEKAPRVEVGKPAPDFQLPATQIDKVLPETKDKKTLSLKDLQQGAHAKNVVLFFFPKAMTRG